MTFFSCAKSLPAKILFVTLLICFIAPSVWCNSRLPFKVQISIDQDSFEKLGYKKTGQFYVDTTVTNVSGVDQVIHTWTNYAWNWTSSNPGIAPNQAALKNIAVDITVKAGMIYSGKVLMSSVRSFPDRTFRLGFVAAHPKGTLGFPLPAFTDTKVSKGISWSNPLTLPQ